MVSVEAGYGYAKSKNDNYYLKATDAQEATAEWDDASTWYIQAPIQVIKGGFITPEVGQVNQGNGPTGQNQGYSTYYGMKFTFDF
jgi:hypothetical protein